MKKVINKPEDLVIEMCEGMIKAHPTQLGIGRRSGARPADRRDGTGGRAVEHPESVVVGRCGRQTRSIHLDRVIARGGGDHRAGRRDRGETSGYHGQHRTTPLPIMDRVQFQKKPGA